MQKKYGKKGFVLLALSYEPTSKVKPYVPKHKISYIVASEAEKTKNEYGIKGYPTAFIIDPDGKIAWKGHPMRPEAEGTIQRLLKENPPKGGNLLVARAAKTAYAKALKLYKKHRYAKALKAFEKIARKHKGTLYAKKALRKAKKIKADKKIMAGIRRREMRRKCESWLDTARTLVKMGKTDEAAEYYRRVFEKYPDSKYARVARQEMDSL